MQSRAGGRQGTGYRPVGTALRQGTGYNPDLANSIGMNANLNLQDRPVTQQGLGGLKTGNKGPQRQFYDRTFFLNELKKKNQLLVSEIDKFRKDIDKIEKDHEVYSKLERRYEDLSKEVRELEGSLADYNLAIDKQRAGAKPEDMEPTIYHLKKKNAEYRQHLDGIFIERKEQEDEINKIENELRSLIEMEEIKMNELNEDQKREYNLLSSKNKKIQQDNMRSKMEMDELQNKVSQQEEKLNMDQKRMKIITLRNQIKELTERKKDLDQQYEESKMSPQELRDILFKRMREDKERMTGADSRNRELRKGVDQMKRRIAEIEEEISGNNQISEDNKKRYEAIYEKEKEIEKYMQDFRRIRENEMNEMADRQDQVIQYLENISQTLDLMKNTPTQEQYYKLKENGTLSYEENDSEERIYQLAKGHVIKKMNDINKINEMEGKLPSRIKELEENLQMMKTELNKYRNIERVKSDMIEKREEYERRTRKLYEVQGSMQEQLRDAQASFKKKKGDLQKHESYLMFTELETKVATNEKLINNMKAYIASKSQEMNMEPMLESCRKIANEINNITVSQ